MKSFSTRTLALLAMFTAISIILSRLLGFYLTESLRISFEYFPIILAGICFGPVAGAVVGGLADFVGATLLSGLGFFPLLIFAPILAGFISGLMPQYIFKNRMDSWWKVMVISAAADILANLLWGTFALSHTFNIPFLVSLAARAPFKLAIMVIDAQLVFVILRALQPILRLRRT